jgi:hypothetical protein
MISALLFKLLLAMSTAGFWLLATSQRQHRAVVASTFPAMLVAPWVQRLMGSMLLLASALIAIARDGIAFGITIWVLTISISAFAVVAWLSWLGSRSKHSTTSEPDGDDISA